MPTALLSLALPAKVDPAHWQSSYALFLFFSTFLRFLFGNQSELGSALIKKAQSQETQ
jgi:hypothetical protein